MLKQPEKQQRGRLESIGFMEQAEAVGDLPARSDVQGNYINNNQNQGREWPRGSPSRTAAAVVEERHKVLKGLLQYYTKEQNFHPSFESNWESHNVDYQQNCTHWDVPEKDKVIFFRYSLVHESDERQYYDLKILNSKENGAELKWKT